MRRPPRTSLSLREVFLPNKTAAWSMRRMARNCGPPIKTHHTRHIHRWAGSRRWLTGRAGMSLFAIRRGQIVCAADAFEQRSGPHWTHNVSYGWSTPYDFEPFHDSGEQNQRNHFEEAHYYNPEHRHDAFPTYQYVPAIPLPRTDLINPFSTLRTLDPSSPISPISPATLQASEWARAGMMAISSQWDGDEYMSMSE